MVRTGANKRQVKDHQLGSIFYRGIGPKVGKPEETKLASFMATQNTTKQLNTPTKQGNAMVWHSLGLKLSTAVTRFKQRDEVLTACHP